MFRWFTKYDLTSCILGFGIYVCTDWNYDQWRLWVTFAVSGMVIATIELFEKHSMRNRKE